MSVVERENAAIGKQIRMRVGFRTDRTGTLFNPDSIDEVVILDSDHVTVLETIDVNNIVNYEIPGKFYFESSASWNTASNKVFDRWKVTVDGVTYYLEDSTFIPAASAPSIGLASFVTLVKKKVQAPTIGPVASGLADPADYETFILEAVKEYSKRKPDKKVVKLTGDGNAFFSLPNDWEDGFSWIKNIEYPISQFPPYFIQRKFYKVEEIDTGLICRFYDYGYPGDGNFFYFRYAVRHVVDDSSSTIQLADKDSLCNLAASISCQALAQLYGQTADSSLAADSINYRTRGDEFASRAKELFKLYNRHVKPEITGLISEWDIESYWEGNRDLLLKSSTMI